MTEGHITTLHTIDEMERLVALFARVWGFTPGDGLVSADFLRALEHAGGYVAAAWLDDRMVGGSFGFRGVHRGQPCLHSHVTGVEPGHEHAGLGRRLKMHQRAWALDHHLPTITWTFDPLVRRNAWFNLQRLGVTCDEFQVNFYGPLRDAINGDDETDRLLAVWDLAGSRAVAAADGLLEPPSTDEVAGAGAHPLLVVGHDGEPVETPVPPGAGRTLLVQVPIDIVALRQDHADDDPGLARRWRLAVRDTLGAAVQRGYVATDMTRDGHYVLRFAHGHHEDQQP